jgi:hypothetical protein
MYITDFGDTLKSVKTAPHKNVTLSLPEPLLRRFRVYAASRNQSMTKVMAEAISKMMELDGESEKADRRFLKRIRNAADRGTGKVIRWTREELHER